MNTIKGLLLKDLYVFRNFKGNLIFSAIMFIILITIGSISRDIFLIGSILFLIFFGIQINICYRYQ